MIKMEIPWYIIRHTLISRKRDGKPRMIGGQLARLEAITESRGNNQGDEKKGKTVKRVREGQARERKKEGKPAYFGAHVKRTRFRKTGLAKSKKAMGRSSYTTARHST